MLADCDAGNVVTAAQSGVQWGYRLTPVLLVLTPLLFMVQDLCSRLGYQTGTGFGELIRHRFGRACAFVCAAGLVATVFGTLVTEFTGIAGVGEMYGVPHCVSIAAAAAMLVGLCFVGSRSRVNAIAMVVGSMELAFLAVAWRLHPQVRVISSQLHDFPIKNPDFSYLVVALVGSTFNPWMMFYHQAATAHGTLTVSAQKMARLETVFGAVLTQGLTAAILIAAATLPGTWNTHSIQTVGDISQLLTSVIGPVPGRILFSVGLLGASLVAAFVSGQALSWGITGLVGDIRTSQIRPENTPPFLLTYVLAILGSASLTIDINDLVKLNIAVQAANALLLPLAVALLIVLSVTDLPPYCRPRKRMMTALTLAMTLVAATVLFGTARAVQSLI